MLAGLTALAVLAGVACGGDDGSATTPASAADTEVTVAVAPLPPARPTTTLSSDPTAASTTPAASASTSSVPSTAATATSVSPTSSTSASAVATTTTRPAATPAAGPCDLTRIVTETGAVYDAITPDELRCAGVWATWIGRPDDQFADGFFAVAVWDGDSWVLANLGTAGVCDGAGVPAELWSRLGCLE